MKKNNFISLLLAVTLIFSAFTFSVVAQDATINTNLYSEEIEFLKSIKILTDDFSGQEKVKKAELAQMIAKILYPDVDFSSAGSDDVDLFSDVSKDHKYFSYIKACKDLSIIKGDNENKFYPDSEITSLITITMLVNALGYTPYAIQKGGFPTGYYQIAKESGIVKGIDLSNTSALNGETVARFIYNALFANLVSITSVTNEDVTVAIQQDKNILSEHLGIKEYDARVVDNGITSISGSETFDTKKVVMTQNGNGVKLAAYVGNTNIGEYLGSRVKVFIQYNKENARDEVVYFNVHKNSSETVLNADSILNINENYMEYETEKNSAQYEKLKFDSVPPVVVLNGTQLTNYDFRTLNPEDGFIKAIDYDKNGTVEFLNIISFNYNNGKKDKSARNIVVDKVNSEDGYINCKFNPSSSLDLDSNLADYKIINSGGIKTLEDIEENTVVSVAQSPLPINGKQFYYLIVSNNPIEGSISQSNADTKEITVNNNDYQVSSSITSIKETLIEKLAFNQTMNFLLDATGKIAYIKNIASKSKKYAYLINAVIEEHGDKVIKAKVFTKDCEIRIFELNSKVIIDGASCTDANSAFTALKTRPSESANISSDYLSRPITIELNEEDRITKIDTETPNDKNSSDITVYSSQNFIKYSQAEVDNNNALKAGFRNIRISEVDQIKRSVEGRFYLTNDTVIMNVPDIDPYGLDKYQDYLSNKNDSNQKQAIDYKMVKLYEANLEDKNYKILTLDSLNYMFAYDIQGYDIDPDTGIASYAILRGRTDAYLYGMVPYSTAYPMYVFLKKSTVYDVESQKSITKIYYTKDGYEEKSVLVDTDDTLFSYKYIIDGCDRKFTSYDTEVTALTKGDIIRVIEKEGWLKHIERVFRIEKVATTVYSAPMYPTNTRVLYSKTLYGMIAGNMPNDQRSYFAGFFNSYTLGVSYVKQIKGNRMLAVLGKTYASDVDIKVPSTYIEQYFDIAGIPITVIDIDKNGEVRVKTGELSDIKTILPDTGKENASLIMFKHANYKMEQIIVLNDAR